MLSACLLMYYHQVKISKQKRVGLVVTISVADNNLTFSTIVGTTARIIMKV